MLRTLIHFTLYTLHMLHAKSMTDYPTPTNTPTPPSCEYEGKFYPPGVGFAEGKEGEWCYGRYCDDDGNVIPWNDFNCGTTTSPPNTTPPSTTISNSTPPPTTVPETTSPKTTSPQSTIPKSPSEQTTTPPSTKRPTSLPPSSACEFEGKFYSHGESFGEGTDGEGWCYGSYCDEDGNVISWDDFNCGTTTSPPHTTIKNTTPPPKPETTPPPTTVPENTPHPTTVPETITPKTTTPQTTTPKSPLEQTTMDPTMYPPGSCEYNGKLYFPGEDISEGTDGDGWCFGVFCDHDGGLRTWDDFNCGTTTSSTLIVNVPENTTPKTTIPQSTTPTSLPEQTTTPPSTRQPTTYPPHEGCEHEGKFYPPGEISQGTDGKNWCYGLVCDSHGQVIAWDNWRCGTTPPTTYPYTTSPPIPTSIPRSLSSTMPTTAGTSPTTPATRPSPTTPSLQTTPNESSPPVAKPNSTTTSSPSTPQPGFGRCYLKGQYFEDGEIISRIHHGWNWCTGWYCNDGKVDSWNNFNCVNPTTFPMGEEKLEKTTASAATGDLRCYHSGVYYNDGDLVDLDESSGACDRLYCSSGSLLSFEDSDCGSTMEANGPTSESSQPTTVSGIDTNQHTTEINLPSTTVSGTDNNQHTTEIYPPTTQATLPTTDEKEPTTRHTKPTIITAKVHTKELSDGPSSLCFVDGKYYTDGHVISQNKYHTGNCYGLLCRRGEVIPWFGVCKTLTQDGQSTTHGPTAHSNTQIMTTTKSPDPILCFHDGKYYADGDVISRNFDGDNWCSGWHCKGGQLIPLDCSAITTSVPKEVTPSLAPEKDTQPTTLGPEPSRCFHEGRFYVEGDLALTNFESDDLCSGLLCQGGKMVLWDNCGIEGTDGESTPSTQFTRTPHATEVPKGTTKTPESTAETPITIKLSTKATTKTITRIPDINTMTAKGTIGSTTRGPRTPDITTRTPDITTRTPNITTKLPEITTRTPDTTTGTPDTTTKVPDTTETTPDTSTTTPDITTRTPDTTTGTPDTTTTVPDTTETTPDTSTTTIDITTRTPNTTPIPTTPEKLRCYYKGLLYPPGEVTRGFLDDGRCFGVICDISGVIVQWVSATCTPSEPTTPTMKASLPGCVYNDKYYPPGRISRISDDSNWCLDVICNDDGKITSLNNWNCNQATTPAPTPSTTLRPEGAMCFYNGMKYPPGIINEGSDENGWCYKVVCQDNGQLYLWGDWHCKQKPTSTTPLPTTLPAAMVCLYNGRDYPVGEVTRGEDSTGWCYGVNCREDGQVILWGSFKCKA